MADRFTYHIFTQEKSVPNESAVLTNLLEAGADYIHLRKPDWSMEMLGDLVSEIPGKYHRRLVLHSHPGLAGRFGTGFQLNSRCHEAPEAAFLSASCHGIDEVLSMKNMEFVTLSPVFDSISKHGYHARIDADTLPLGNIPARVVALGGVVPDKVSYLREKGFSGAAFLGAVWNKENGVAEMIRHLRLRNTYLQFITDGAGIAETVAQASDVLAGGCRWVQVRMKGCDAGEVRETLQELLPKCSDRGATLVVDDFVDLAGFCHGVHLGQNDMPVAEARKQLPADSIVGLTVNTVEQIQKSMDSLPDYYGIGPFRFTSTKKNLAPVLGIEGYRDISPVVPKPYVAIGGITPEDIPALLAAGASGIAVSSVITKAENPVEMTKKIINILNG